MTNPKHTSSDLEAQLRTNFYAQCKEFADRIAALEVENERLQQTGAFLLARLDDLEWLDGQLEETARDYFGHVEPAIYHFRAALGEKP